MKLIQRSILILIVLLVWQESEAQFYKNQGYWRKNRTQLIGGLGASNFLGELGGRNQIGSDFIWDLEMKQFKPALTIGIKYAVTNKVAIRGQLSYAMLAGDDALTAEMFRSNRNINFRSHAWELAGVCEVIMHQVRPGHKYNLTGVKGTKPRAANIYAFAGIGLLKFNPQGYQDGNWYNLKPLGTEGQNLGGAESYSLYTIVIPMGLGCRWQLKSQNVMVGFEIGHRLTFSDYIDDVSTVYYDNAKLADQPGFTTEENLLAAYFADPSLGYYVEDGNTFPLNSTGTGTQRGDSEDNDAYLFAQVTMSYKLGKSVYRKKSSAKRKGRKVVF